MLLNITYFILCILSFFINVQELKSTESNKDLGVIFSKNLKWKNQVISCVSKAIQSIEIFEILNYNKLFFKRIYKLVFQPNMTEPPNGIDVSQTLNNDTSTAPVIASSSGDNFAVLQVPKKMKPKQKNIDRTYFSHIRRL